MKAHPILLVLVSSLTMFATTVRPISIERLTQESSHVLAARAMESRSMWNASHTRIFTYTRFENMSQMKGSMPATFIVKQLGGHAEGYTMKVAGVHGWQTGENVVLFLQPSGDSDGTFSVTGLMQGNFRLARQPSGEVMVSNGVPDVSQFETSGEVRAYRGSRMTLQELEQRVRKAAQ